MSAEHRPSREESLSRAASRWKAAKKFYQWEEKALALPPAKTEQYKYDPISYMKEVFGWEPWRGNGHGPGQAEIFDAYILAIRQQEERNAYEQGEIDEDALQHWKPGQVIQNRIRIEAGHTVGKTRSAAGIVSHFFDHFHSIVYTFAPTWRQVKLLLWKEIKTDRNRPGLIGNVLETCEIKVAEEPDHFAIGTATSDAKGQGTERVQGQHGGYLMFVLDEAEGVADYVYDAIDSMASGGISIVIMLANPRTRTSRFHKQAAFSNVLSLRIPCIYHPNVMEGREVIPGAVRRDYVESMIEAHCEIVKEHNPDEHTFTLPYDVTVKGTLRPVGTIFLPDTEFLFRVLGIAPANTSDKNAVPSGRFQAAVGRVPVEKDPQKIRVGVDAARGGNDFGTVYINWNGRVWREGRLSKLDTTAYYHAVREPLLALKKAHREIVDCQIRVDAGGNVAKGAVDRLKIDNDLIEAFPAQFRVFEVNNGFDPQDEKAYFNCITELTFDVAETLKTIAIIDPPEQLEPDLCEREYEWRNKKGHEVKKLEDKVEFKKRLGRSPDDGDGFVLAVASDFLIKQTEGAFSTVGHSRATSLLDKILKTANPNM